MARLQLLGGLALTVAGRTLGGAVAQRHRLALLALLARAPGRCLSRERLAAFLWPEADPQHGRNQLRVSLHLLRKELGQEVLRSAGEDLVLNESVVSVDASEFEAAIAAGDLERAAGLHAGAFLEGFHLPDAEEFEHWADGERAAIEREYAMVLERLAVAAGERGDLQGAVEWWQRAATRDPWDSRVALALMQALARAGNPAGALQHARVHTSLLRDELGAPPDAAIADLVRQLTESPAAVVARADPAGPEPERVPSPLPSAGATVPGDARGTTVQPAPAPETFSAVQPARNGPDGARTPAGIALLAAAAVILFGVVAVAMTLNGRVNGGAAESGVVEPPSAPLDPKRVLVLPLENRTGAEDLETTGFVAADWMTRGLRQSGLVEVIDPATAFRLWNLPDSSGTAPTPAARIREVAGVTMAGTLVTGSYHTRGPDLVFEVHVTDTRDGTVLRALDEVSGNPDDPMPAIGELRDRVMGALGILLDERLSGIAAKTLRPPTWQAYTEYALGIEQLSRREDRLADEHFRRAAELDTTFLLPRLWMLFATEDLTLLYDRNDSLLTTLASRQDRLPPADRAAVQMYLARRDGNPEAALAAARRAARLAPQSNWVWKAADLAYRLGRPREALAELESLDPMRGWVRGWNPYWMLRTDALRAMGEHEAALTLERSAEIALRGTSAERTLHRYQIIDLVALGRVQEALAQVDADIRGRRAGDPVPITDLWAAMLLRGTGHQLRHHGYREEALALFERCIAWLDRTPSSELTRQHLIRKGDCLYDAERWQEAYELFRALDESGSGSITSQTALAAARLGRTEEAELWLREVGVYRPWNWRWQIGFRKARIAAVLGRKELALEFLQQVNEPGSLINAIRTSGDFEILKGDPVFEALLHPRR